MSTKIGQLEIGAIRNVKASGDEPNVYFADVEICFEENLGFESCLYVARQDDFAATGKFIYQQIVDGSFEGELIQLPPTPPYVAPASENKSEAQRRLAATDWVNQPDVYDPANTPHLTNRDAFIAYRSQVRAIVVSLAEGNLDWPTEPTAVWSS